MMDRFAHMLVRDGEDEGEENDATECPSYYFKDPNTR